MTAVLIASPLERELAGRITEVDKRVELLYDPALVPASRFMGDIAGEFAPDPARWAELLERAAVLFGIPGSSARGLVDAAVQDEVARQVELFCDNLRRYLAGEELRNRVDLQLLY